MTSASADGSPDDTMELRGRNRMTTFMRQKALSCQKFVQARHLDTHS